MATASHALEKAILYGELKAETQIKLDWYIQPWKLLYSE